MLLKITLLLIVISIALFIIRCKSILERKCIVGGIHDKQNQTIVLQA